MPLAGGFFFGDDERSHERFPMHLVRCSECTLMQIAETVRPDLIFSTYSYSSSVNRTLVTHNIEHAKELRELAGKQGLIVEIGCNDGVLLNPLTTLGARVVGVDPSDVAERASQAHGWPLYRSYFDGAAAKKVRVERGAASVIVANNVCAHVDDPNGMIAGVAELLATNGKFIFEVHYQGDLVATRQYDTVYHEHTCYYSLASLEVLLGQHQMTIVDAKRIPIHGGSIRIAAVKSSANLSRSERAEHLFEEEQTLNVAEFARDVRRHRGVLRDLVANLRRAGKRVVAYGASGRATVLMNACQLGPDLIDHVSDLSPLRYGRVVPGVCVPILPRSHFHASYPDYALITAWNYEAEIVADEQVFLNAGNSFIIPLPAIRLR